MALQAKRVTADGAVFASGIDANIYAITLTGGSDAATLDVKEGGSGGTVIWTLKAAANTSASVEFSHPIAVSDAYADLTGTGPSAQFAAEPLN